MDYWADKTALITGGSSGLGRAIAEVLARRGAQLLLAARHRHPLRATADQLADQGAIVHTLPADVTRQADVDRLFAAADDRWGKLDLVICCAGRSDRAAVLDVTPEEARDLFELNLLGTMRCVRAGVPRLRATGGHLVMIGSLASKVGTPYHGAYPATKAALAAYAQQLRLALSRQDVHVLLVCPGPIAAPADSGNRAHVSSKAGLPETARRPGAGARIAAVDPHRLANRILRACQRRRPELIVPGRARLLFAAAALSPTVGDWLVRRFTGPS